MKNTVAKCWLNGGTSRGWVHFRMRKKDFNFQRKILVGWPRISTEASQVGHSVAWHLTLDLRHADYPISLHSKTILKLYRWSYCNVDALEIFTPLLYAIPDMEDDENIAIYLVSLQPMWIQILLKWFRQIILKQPYWLLDLKTIFFLAICINLVENELSSLFCWF